MPRNFPPVMQAAPRGAAGATKPLMGKHRRTAGEWDTGRTDSGGHFGDRTMQRSRRNNRRTHSGGKRLSDRVTSHLETLESRKYFAVVASFNPGAGILSVFGDSLDNNITVSRDA